MSTYPVSYLSYLENLIKYMNTIQHLFFLGRVKITSIIPNLIKNFYSLNGSCMTWYRLEQISREVWTYYLWTFVHLGTLSKLTNLTYLTNIISSNVLNTCFQWYSINCAPLNGFVMTLFFVPTTISWNTTMIALPVKMLLGACMTKATFALSTVIMRAQLKNLVDPSTI